MPGSLAHSPADVLRWLLVAAGQGTAPTSKAAWPIAAASEPNLPDDSLTLTDTQGRAEGRTNPDSERQEHPGVQIAVRSALPTTGFLKAQAVGVYLDGIANQSVSCPAAGAVPASTYVVAAVTRTSTISVPTGKETPSTKRNLFTINAVLVLRQTS